MINFIVGVLVLVVIILIFLGIWLYRKRNFGLGGKVIYSDVPGQKGETLFAKTLPLMGRPDYLIKTNGMIIPVEIKSGKTPTRPYNSHIAQVTVYCMLIEDNYQFVPPYGVIKYPEKEFKIDFTLANKKLVIESLIKMRGYADGTNGFSPEGSKLCRNCQIST